MLDDVDCKYCFRKMMCWMMSREMNGWLFGILFLAGGIYLYICVSMWILWWCYWRRMDGLFLILWYTDTCDQTAVAREESRRETKWKQGLEGKQEQWYPLLLLYIPLYTLRIQQINGRILHHNRLCGRLYITRGNLVEREGTPLGIWCLLHNFPQNPQKRDVHVFYPDEGEFYVASQWKDGSIITTRWQLR